MVRSLIKVRPYIIAKCDVLKSNRSFNILRFQNWWPVSSISSWSNTLYKRSAQARALWSSDKTEGNIIKWLGVLVDIIEEGHQLTNCEVEILKWFVPHQIQPPLHKSRHSQRSRRVDSWKNKKDSGLGILGIGFIRPLKALRKWSWALKDWIKLSCVKDSSINWVWRPRPWSASWKKRIRTFGNKTSNQRDKRVKTSTATIIKEIQLCHGYNGYKNGWKRP